MKASFQNIGDIFAEPSALFTRLKSVPRWSLAFGLICLASLFITWGRTPFEEQLIRQSGETASSLISQTGLIVTQTTMRCVGLLIEAALLSLLLTIAARLFKIPGDVKFRHIYAILIHLLLLRTFGELINTALLINLREVTDINTPVDMQLLPGPHQLAFFINNAKLKLFLSGFHVVALWELACLTIAIKVVAEVSRLQAVLTTVGIWLLNVVLSVIFLFASAT